jgi:hypothetical protein
LNKLLDDELYSGAIIFFRCYNRCFFFKKENHFAIVQKIGASYTVFFNFIGIHDVDEACLQLHDVAKRFAHVGHLLEATIWKYDACC